MPVLKEYREEKEWKYTSKLMQTLTSTQVDLAIYLLSYLILVAYLI
jgi:hypothetical protein